MSCPYVCLVSCAVLNGLRVCHSASAYQSLGDRSFRLNKSRMSVRISVFYRAASCVFFFIPRMVGKEAVVQLCADEHHLQVDSIAQEGMVAHMTLPPEGAVKKEANPVSYGCRGAHAM